MEILIFINLFQNITCLKGHNNLNDPYVLQLINTPGVFIVGIILLFSRVIDFFGLVSDSSSLNDMSSFSDTNSSLSDISILSMMSSFLIGSPKINQ